MGLFDYHRDEGFPTQYASYKTPVTVDVLEAGLILAFVIIAVTFLMIIPGYNRKKSIYTIVKVFFSILIGCLLMVGNFGQEWEVGSVATKTPYRAGSEHEIKAMVGVKIGLRSVNVTLQGEFTSKPKEGEPLAEEIINYNERFPWTWDQGRLGFGPYAGLLQRSFRAAQRKGLPLPILWVVDYFVVDGEGLRWGRFYRTAGWYTHILMWTAFSTWILANIFLQSVGRYTAYFTAITGVLQLLACLVWSTVRNPNPLSIPFEEGLITTRFGASFYHSLFCGLLCLVLASIIIIMDLRFPDYLSDFLGIDPLDEYDDCLLEGDELDQLRCHLKNKDNAMEMQSVPNSGVGGDAMRVLKRRSTVKKAQKALFRTPAPKEVFNEEFPIVNEPSGSGISQSKERLVKYADPPPVPRKTKRRSNHLYQPQQN